MSGSFEQAAWSWVDHLRRGGTTPWLDWARADLPAPVELPAGPLPGAAQAELVRRLALAGGSGDDFTRLADRALHRTGPGRGLPELALARPAAGGRPGSGPGVDPARIPASELARVCSGLLADLLLDSRVADEPRPVRLRRRPFHLEGSPIAVAAVRSSLRAAGYAEAGPGRWRDRRTVLVLAEPFAQQLFSVWSARVQRGSPATWERFVGRWAHRPEPPPALSLDRIARRWAGRVGPANVHVVVVSEDETWWRTAERVLGLPAQGAYGARVRPTSPAALDALRRVNAVLSVRVSAERRAGLARVARDALADERQGWLAVPATYAAWADDRARRLVGELGTGGYAVHGDLEELALRRGDGPTRPAPRAVLDLLVAGCLSLAQHRGEEGGRG